MEPKKVIVTPERSTTPRTIKKIDNNSNLLKSTKSSENNRSLTPVAKREIIEKEKEKFTKIKDIDIDSNLLKTTTAFD